MSERVVGTIDPQGRPIARKQAMRPMEEASLAWEIEVLTDVRHPGVVEVVASAAGALDTIYCGTRSLATWRPTTIDQVATLSATLAASVADLHALGVVHGRLDPSHVLVGAEDRPILCGFSGATLRGRPSPPASAPADGFGDPAVESGPIDASADVFGIGSLVSFLVRGGDRHRPRAGRRRFPSPFAMAGAARRRAALRRIAGAATCPEPGLRPTSRTVAATLRHVAPRLPARRARRPWARIGAATAAATAAVVTCGWGAVAVITALARHPPEPAPVTTAVTSASTSSTSIDVGLPGDQAISGDWDCDGVPTVALLRPSTGEVFVFAQPAATNGKLTIPASAHVPGAQRIIADDDDGDGCPSVLVERGGGRRAVEVSG